MSASLEQAAPFVRSARAPHPLRRAPVHLAGLVLFFLSLAGVERAGAFLGFGQVEVGAGLFLSEVVLWAQALAYPAAVAAIRYTELFHGGNR